MENFEHLLLTQLIAVIQSAAKDISFDCFEEGESGACKYVCNFGAFIFVAFYFKSNWLEDLKNITVSG